MNYGLRSICFLGSLVVMGATGCDFRAPEFHLNMVQMVSDATPTPVEYQEQIANVLGGMFGDPDEPFALPETGLDIRRLKMAAGPAWTDQKGAAFGLYRQHCSHCHGIDGDGMGPTALFLNPYPRDYRQGVYKFKSTYNPAKPTDEDLHRVLVNGIPGSAMPSFSLLPSAEVEALVEYVKYLSFRGQMETALTNYVYNDLGEEEVTDENGDPVLDDEGEPVTKLIPLDPENDPEQQEVIKELLAEIVDGWNEANEQIIVPAEDAIPTDVSDMKKFAESAAKGRELFYGTRANCMKCHGPTGLGDGQQDDYDIWNKAHLQFLESVAEDPGEGEIAQDRTEVAESLFPVRNAIPRNLRKGIYRGGNRRIDLFWRIYAGIAGSPMPGSGPASPGAQGTLTEEEMWNIVDYVLSLPYENASQPQRALPINTELVN
ncbi:cytochrome c [Bythopirellula polymerisocia]|uniref:Cytochrome c n=1 Tax=Bythopirellula polymerisocia TaxID=2528003 RepID=A0A5C6CHQ9_9BACT|nr:cytochrome c [Bythopirellula polymerisocia]TWU23565.1 Cytochrome c [Bythopirellula polymerisocia]